MGNLFGKKKVSRVTEHDKAVLQVKQQRDKVKQYQQRVETKLENDRQLAKKLLQSGQRDRAKLLLKKKRYQESLLERSDGQLENLEKIISDLEFAQVELKVVEGLKVGNETLKKLNDLLNIDEIERIMDETKEGQEKQEEISQLLSGNLSVEDLEEVEREYNELLEMEEAEKNIDLKAKLPDVPLHEPSILATKEIADKQPTKEKIAMEAA
ncbi:Charged multivesicular body protein [Nesidiocoris tenuis]|uniref:Charged multivesicular body protein n=1 Tax=Nesidiocoris tenuis TaxID=355587 RepID=A0ABN7AT92_9HEMI|nr:Charged multivesicular body protein [Nesidiocoris tenuis]